MTAQGFTDHGTYMPDNLLAGEFPSIQRIRTITGSAAFSRGAVLGRITVSGLYTLSDASATDGSQKPAAILGEDADATSEDVQAAVFYAGEFNSNALIYGAGHDAASVSSSLRDVGPHTIFLRENQES